MSIRKFRRMTRAERRRLIDLIEDPLAKRILLAAFMGPGKRSWVQVSLIVGGDNTPDTVRMIATRALDSLDHPARKPGRPRRPR